MSLKKDLVAVGFFANQADAVLGAVETGITADTGSAQADSYPITKAVSVVSTVGTIGDSLILPVASAGDELWVRNNGANSADVFPQSGGAINGGSANAALAVAASKTVIFKNIGGANWIAVTTA